MSNSGVASGLQGAGKLSALLSGFPWYPIAPASSATGNSLSANTLRLSPFLCPVPVTITAIGADVNVAGAGTGCTFNPAIYSNGAGNVPGRLLAGPPGIGVTGGTGNFTTALPGPLTLTPGYYWIGGVLLGTYTTQPTMRVIGGGSVLPALPIVTTQGNPEGASTYGYGYTGINALPADLSAVVPIGSTTPEPRLFFVLA